MPTLATGALLDALGTVGPGAGVAWIAMSAALLIAAVAAPTVVSGGRGTRDGTMTDGRRAASA
ncbi:hypothetical protein [Tsukamurella spumae]|uniref:Uncharacterized protein n=1 Tax=Tsukamurella spumae TaxID=44753 RepID=A0A846X690_9ACTN|nr:hypothetical protein [Tsukamurella spumae]NKY20984.1 hypothetical protein [Tsukamurella spumae]